MLLDRIEPKTKEAPDMKSCLVLDTALATPPFNPIPVQKYSYDQVSFP